MVCDVVLRKATMRAIHLRRLPMRDELSRPLAQPLFTAVAKQARDSISAASLRCYEPFCSALSRITSRLAILHLKVRCPFDAAAGFVVKLSSMSAAGKGLILHPVDIHRWM